MFPCLIQVSRLAQDNDCSPALVILTDAAKRERDVTELFYKSWRQRLEVAHGIACGVAYMHTSGSEPIVHRDLYSSNVLLDYDYTKCPSSLMLKAKVG